MDQAAPREFLTATALFRLYVILETGNERGSETVTVTRP